MAVKGTKKVINNKNSYLGKCKLCAFMCANKKATHKIHCKWLIFSDPRGIQTPNLLIRSQLLYSVELWGQFK
jgi:hypothetical protein